MNTFEFMYGDSWYKYEDGLIHKQGTHEGWWIPLFQVDDLDLSSFDATQLPTVMFALMCGYGHGIVRGKKEKIAEFKRVFNID